MPRLRSLSLVLSLVTLSTTLPVAAARAQDAAGAQQARTATAAAAPSVTASARAGRVRVAAPDQSALRLELYTESGERVFDSDFRAGNVADFQTADANRALADGSYLLVVTTRDLQGRLRQRLGSVAVEGGRVARLAQTGEEKLGAAQLDALAAGRNEKGVKLSGLAASVTVLAGGDETAVTAATHDGREGQLTSTKGALTLRTGDVLKGEDVERVRVTEDGRVGIGTDKPEATLDVAGTVRARGGIMFDDGTVLKSAGDARGAADATNAAGEATTDATGTGTTSSLAKWTDGPNGVLGDSVITESAGKVGIGTAAPQFPLHISSPTFGQMYASGGSAADFLMFHTNAPVNTRWTGVRSQDGRGKISSFNDIGTYRVENILTWSNTNGNVALGAAPGTEKLEVAGNLKVNGAGNGIVFPDGTKLTTAPGGGATAVQFVPAAEQLSVGDANGTAAMINLRGGSTCCSGPGGHTPAFFKVFQNGSFVATGNLGIGTSPMEGKGYRTSWHTYKGAFRSGYADNEWDDANVGFFSWAGGSNSTASGLYALAFGDTNFARSTSSIAFGSGNEVKGAAGFSAGAGNRVCDTYGVALGNNAKSGGPYIDGKCDPETFNIRGLAAVAIGYNVTADQDHTMALGKFASNNGFQGTFIWSDGAPQASADTFRNTANNEFAARATGGFRFRTNLGGTTGCNLPAGSGVFNCTSSRHTKENFTAVSGEDVLSRLRKVPVTTWNYISEGQQVRHLGPMAEDFYTAFGLGTGNASIGVQDLASVSIAAVKALDERTAELQKRTAEVEQLRAQVTTLEQRLAALEQAVRAKEQK